MLLIYRYLRAVHGRRLDTPAVFFAPCLLDGPRVSGSISATAPRLISLPQSSAWADFPYRMGTVRRDFDAARPSRVAGS
jgi:hypothetical protein